MMKPGRGDGSYRLIFSYARVLFRLYLLIVITLWSQLAFSERTITLVGDPWPPFVEGKLGEEAQSGIAVEIVNEIFLQLDNVKARFPLIPWKRALREVEEGYQDGVVILLKTPERERYMAYTEPLLIDDSLVWSVEDPERGHFEWNEVNDFQGIKVGVIRGYSYGEAIDRQIENGTIMAVFAPTVQHLFAMLANGRIDVALSNKSVGLSQIKKFPDASIRFAQRPTDTETFYMGLSKKSRAVELIPDINRILKKLNDDGVIERIIRAR